MKSFYVGVKGIIVRDNSILLLKRSKKETSQSFFWDAPGGRIDGEESFEETLNRELREELTNIKDISIERLLHVFRLPFDVQNARGLIFLFFKINADLGEIVLSEEHEEYRWVHKDEFEEFMKTESDRMSDGIKRLLSLVFIEK